MSAFIDFQNEVKKARKPAVYFFRNKAEKILVKALYEKDGTEKFFIKYGKRSEVEKTMEESKLLTDTLLEQDRITKYRYDKFSL